MINWMFYHWAIIAGHDILIFDYHRLDLFYPHIGHLYIKYLKLSAILVTKSVPFPGNELTLKLNNLGPTFQHPWNFFWQFSSFLFDEI